MTKGAQQKRREGGEEGEATERVSRVPPFLGTAAVGQLLLLLLLLTVR